MAEKKSPAPLNILILQDRGFPRLHSDDAVSRSTFALPSEAKLFLITSNVGASSSAASRNKASKKLAAYAEVPEIHLNGTMELIATSWHEKYKFDCIFCNDEDLLLRAADLRSLFGISKGLLPEHVMAFRDKCMMKNLALEGGVTVPFFSPLRTPACLLSFIKKHGFPVVIKPTCGSSSENIRVLQSKRDAHAFLSMEYFALQTETTQYSGGGGLMVESFVDAPMYHVNGLAEGENILNMWSFRYIGNNLGFTDGRPYGNVSLTKHDPELAALEETARKTIRALIRNSSARFAFHAEFFLVNDGNKKTSAKSTGNDKKQHGGTPKYTFALCEVAARTPGGTILDLISLLNPFQLPDKPSSIPANERRALISRYVFRFLCRLADSAPSPASPSAPSTAVVADLLIPLRRGYALIRRPSSKETLPASLAPHGIDLQYVPTKSAITKRPYYGFDVSVINTAARFIAQMADYEAHPTSFGMPTSNEFERTLERALNWYTSRARFIDCRAYMDMEYNAERDEQSMVSTRMSRSERLAFVAARSARRRHQAGMQVVVTHGGMYNRASRALLARVRRRLQEQYCMSRQVVRAPATSRRAIAEVIADKIRRSTRSRRAAPASGRDASPQTPRSPATNLLPAPRLRKQGSASSIQLASF